MDRFTVIGYVISSVLLFLLGYFNYKNSPVTAGSFIGLAIFLSLVTVYIALYEENFTKEFLTKERVKRFGIWPIVIASSSALITAIALTIGTFLSGVIASISGMTLLVSAFLAVLVRSAETKEG